MCYSISNITKIMFIIWLLYKLLTLKLTCLTVTIDLQSMQKMSDTFLYGSDKTKNAIFAIVRDVCCFDESLMCYTTSNIKKV